MFQARGRAKVLKVYVTSVHWYRSFERMLTIEKVHNCLPTVRSVQDGCKIYRSFPGSYREKTHGVLAFRISAEINQSPKSPPTPLSTPCSQRTAFNTPCKRKRDDDSRLSRQSKLRKRLTFSSSEGEDIQIFSKLSHDVPPRMHNPYNSVKHGSVWNMCYINAVLQLLASSDVCINQCNNNAKGSVANVLSSMRAGLLFSESNMDCLLSHDVFRGDKRKFIIGEPNCAIEFMNWCVEEIQLHYNPRAITHTQIEQICTTCKRVSLVEVKGGPYDRGNGTCIVLASGNITDDTEFDDRIQDCWGNNCPSVNSLSENVVRFREIRLHGEVVIYRWNAPCVQLQLRKHICLTVNTQCNNRKQRKYRLCGFTVFETLKRHYITYRYVLDKLYCCDDYDIYISNHMLAFSTADKRCVMAIYEMIDVKNEAAESQVLSKRHSEFLSKVCPSKRRNRHVAIPPLMSTRAKPSVITGDGLENHWTAVHGDGFCWIYAFLVAVGILKSSDFPHGNATSGPPSARAVKLSRAVAPFAFRTCDDIMFPEYENGKLESLGTFGGAPQFMRLLERIRPPFRFFILDHTHTWVKRALVVKEPRNNDVPLVFNHGTDLTSLYGTFVSNTYAVDYASGHGAQPLQMVYDVTTTLPRHDKYVVYDDTDVVICWESERHFNALSRPSPESATASFLDSILRSPELVPELFPLSNDTTYAYRDSDSDIEELPSLPHCQQTSLGLHKELRVNGTLYTCNESDRDE